MEGMNKFYKVRHDNFLKRKKKKKEKRKKKTRQDRIVTFLESHCLVISVLKEHK